MDSVERSLGRIEGKLSSIEASIAKTTSDIEDHKSESREGRSKIYKELEQTNRAMIEMKHEFASVKEDLATLNGKTKTHEEQLAKISRFEQRVVGAASVVSVAGMILGFFMSAIWKVMSEWLSKKVGL